MFMDRQLDSLLTMPSGVINNYGTGEEKLSEVANTFIELTKILKNLKELPLVIHNIHGVSSTLRLTDVFAPLPSGFKFDQATEKTMRYKNDHKFMPKYPLGPVLVPYVKPLQFACLLESSGRWPDEIECIKRLKSAFYIEIVRLLRDNHGICSVTFRDYCDIVYKGFVYRLSVFTMSELLCMKNSLNEMNILVSKETKETFEYEKRMLHLPKISSVIYA